jgi:acyl-CoA synthetase (AMP-forming)/AMP-acid ligase II
MVDGPKAAGRNPKIAIDKKEEFMNLGRYVSRSAKYYPDHIAIMFEGKQISYKELDKRTNRLAQGLYALGLKKGDRVAIQSWNRPEIAETEVACYKAGMVRIPINARLSAAEATGILNNAEVKALIGDKPHLESLMDNQPSLESVQHFINVDGPSGGTIFYDTLLSENKEESPDVEVEMDELAVLTYSSGTTGKLKGIMQSYGNRMAMIRKALMFPEVRIKPGDKIVHVGPITHVSGMLLMPFFFTGGCNLILNRFDLDMLLDTIQREKVNYTMVVPAMINFVLAYPKARQYKFDSLKGIFYGAAPISPTRVQQAIDLFGPILIQGYGMSETTSFIAVLTASEHTEALKNNPDRLGSCGRPVFDTEIRVVNERGEQVAPGEVGEITARGPDIMKGYYKDPELTQKTIINNWIYSGDMAKVDEEGYIYIVDRKTEMIITGGFNVYPSEIEQVLYRHPSVMEACAIGVPDEKWGEAIKAVVVLKKGCTATEEEIINHCKELLSGYKKPQSVDFVNELPKNPNGKIARRSVKEIYWAGKARRVN